MNASPAQPELREGITLHDEAGAPREWVGLLIYAVAALLAFLPALGVGRDAALMLRRLVDPSAGSPFSGYGIFFAMAAPVLAVLWLVAFIAAARWCGSEPFRWRVHLIGFGLLAGEVALAAFVFLILER